MIDAINLSVQFSGNYLFENANFKINRNDKIALVGANGTGKTTLLRLINEDEHPETGKIQKQKNLKIGYLPQEFVILNNTSLFEEAKSALTEITELIDRENEINSKLSNSDLSDEERDKLILLLGEIEHEKEKLDFYGADAKVRKILTGLGFSNSDFERSTQEFSGGWQMRIELAKILLGNNDLILLDEPTNHLDIDSLRWIIEFLENYPGSILLVSHDRYFVNRITNKTLEIADNKVTLRGSKPKILIDGVESDLTNLLDILPADEIESVEVITNPSAKYDVGEGDGVINIVLKNKRKSNVNGRLFLKMDNKGDHLLSANLNRNQKKFSFGGGVSLTNKSYYANELYSYSTYAKLDTKCGRCRDNCYSY